MAGTQVIAAAQDAPPGAEPAARRGMDAVPFLIAYIMLLVLVPSSKVVAALGGAGTPSVLFGVVLLGLWILLRLSGSPYVQRSITPLHYVWLAYVLAMIASYWVATSNAIGGPEARGADRGLLVTASWSGIFLLTADGILSRRRLEVLLKGLSIGLILEAGITLSQYLLQRNWYIELPFPGLSSAWSAATDTRSGMLRAAGTAVHAIEYGVVQTIVLALTLHWALYSTTRRARIWWWVGASLVLTTIPLALARSPIVALGVMMIMILPTWPRAWLVRAFLLSPFILVGLRAAFPGVLGTVLSLFTWISDDPSTTGRTGDYEQVAVLTQGHLAFGRGMGTVIPQIYLTLDNQYLSALLDTGVVGLLMTILLFGATITVGFRVRSRFSDVASRNLVHSMTTGVAVAAVTWAFFDGFAFQQATGSLHILIGSIAAMTRLTPDRESAPTEPGRRRGLAAVAPWGAAALTGLVALGLGYQHGTSGAYTAMGSVLIRLDDTSRGLYSTNAGQAADLAVNWMRSAQAHQAVAEAGGAADYTIAQGSGSLAPATDVQGRGPVIRMQAISDDVEEVLPTIEAATKVLRARLATSQSASGAPSDQVLVASDITPPSGPYWQGGSQARSRASLLMLSGLLALASYLIVAALVDRRRTRRNHPRATEVPDGTAQH